MIAEFILCCYYGDGNPFGVGKQPAAGKDSTGVQEARFSIYCDPANISPNHLRKTRRVFIRPEAPSMVSNHVVRGDWVHV